MDSIDLCARIRKICKNKGRAMWLNRQGPLRVIPQGTVDNNLGPDRLAGPEALDPKYCRQPTL